MSIKNSLSTIIDESKVAGTRGGGSIDVRMKHIQIRTWDTRTNTKRIEVSGKRVESEGTHSTNH